MKFFNFKNLIRFLIVSLIIYALLIFIGDYNKISIQLKTFNFLIIPIILFFAFIDDFIRFFKWDYFLRRLKIRIPKKTSFLIFFSGLAMSITPAKVGEVLKSYLLKKAEGIEMRRSLMVVVLERLTDVLGLAILSLIGSFAFFGSLYFQILIAILIVLLIFSFAMLTSKKIFLKSSVILSKLPIIKNYVKYIDEIYKSSRSLISVKSLSFATLLSVISWFSECFAFYLLLNSLNVAFSMQASTFVFAFSSIFGNAIILFPGGLVATEGSFVALLLLNKVSLATAILATVLIRLGTLFFGIFIGIISLLITNRFIKNKKI